jgi:hypothetical protein
LLLCSSNARSLSYFFPFLADCFVDGLAFAFFGVGSDSEEEEEEEEEEA